MGDYARGRLDLDDEDRLPWLEPAMDDDGDEGISPLRLLGLILLGLALIGAVVAAVWGIQSRTGGAAGEGRLIAAPADSYKIAAKEADAKKFDGEGDASFAASEGVLRDGRIDPSRVPEAPIAKTRPEPATARPATPAKPAQSVTARVADETNVRPVAAPRPSGGGGLIQLGAYGSAAVARDAWGKLSKRFAYLAPLAMTVEPAEVGGSTVYRLRAGAGGQATMLCGKLKVAGESCMVVN
ncbi:SPOR domain-containing protein [Sphingobium sp. CAP-1]|uniref:SPOR domain-containing protein n=1 Tax=Sphingobium sp. CAP-1 TaxID=2676077 RepID=UPI0012BB3C6A|nr:SPOR domain-containing protein [Sphingobium sp. CAP-1]QGP77922.1 SPOR domain-containing protein [Sphingobium sp. CAP-1]